MNQSTLIAGTLLGGFILFLAARNRLSAYTAVLWGNAGATPPAAPAASSQPSSIFGIPLGSTATSVLNWLPTLTGE